MPSERQMQSSNLSRSSHLIDRRRDTANPSPVQPVGTSPVSKTHRKRVHLVSTLGIPGGTTLYRHGVVGFGRYG